MKEKSFRGSRVLGLTFRIAFSVLVAALVIWKYDEFQSLDVRAIVKSSPNAAAAVAAVLGVYFLKSFVMVVPASLVYIAVGMAFPAAWAVLINAAGMLIEICASYLLGVVLGGPYVVNKLKKAKYGEKILELLGRNKRSAIFLARFIPVFPIDLASLFLGSLRTDFPAYLGLSFLGVFPRAALFTVLGDGIYDYIPMRKIAAFCAAALPIVLAVWIVSYAVKTKKTDTETGKSVYEPLRDFPRSVVFDTDMGPDCDDAGALSLLLKMAKKYGAVPIGAANCVSNPYGNGVIKAIAENSGVKNFPSGRHTGTEILARSFRYNKAVVKKYFKSENEATAAPSALEFYKSVLSPLEDGSAVVVAAGPLTNIAEVLEAEPELFNAKVYSIISMAGKFPSGREFNVKVDPKAFSTVVSRFKNLLIFSGYEVGAGVMTGFTEEPERDDPVFDCYKNFLRKKKPPYLRDSWDLTAVHYAFEGDGKFYSLSRPVKISANKNGRISAKKDESSRAYYIIRNVDAEALAEYLNGFFGDGPSS